MPMREECKHFQSRTYDSGEVARFCILDLAPDAPWKCPENCPRYERRLADVGWDHGTLVEPKLEDMPGVPDEDAASMLGDAEQIVDAVGPEVLAVVEKQEAKEARKAGRGSGRSSGPARWWQRRR
ncbi:MAG: hypothetical protein ACYCV5_02875 [Acidimicrobiales bacterium]